MKTNPFLERFRAAGSIRQFECASLYHRQTAALPFRGGSQTTEIQEVEMRNPSATEVVEYTSECLRCKSVPTSERLLPAYSPRASKYCLRFLIGWRPKFH
jgi:hypothetical protein